MRDPALVMGVINDEVFVVFVVFASEYGDGRTS